ncbi:MAG: TIGR00341 family protein [Rhodobacteraceae bacterium]|nr:TIGR00341 family protein [Paracoccaceae bacterium]
MSVRLILVTVPAENLPRILEIAEEVGVLDCYVASASRAKAKPRTVHLTTADANRQALLDKLQAALHNVKDWRISILDVAASIPVLDEEEDEASKSAKLTQAASESREELYEAIAKGARKNLDFVLLVVLSTIVAAVGLLENNVAVVIGAMVIAPMLGPNLAFALGVALADKDLILKAAATNLLGISITLALTIPIGILWPDGLSSPEVMTRTVVGFDSIAVALASGAAATLSLTSGLSSALVGVMVAVALLPPAATMGLSLGAGRIDLALGALTLLAVNIVCVNLAAQGVFRMRRITPRTWYKKAKARQAGRINALILLLLLVALVVLLYFNTPVAI